MREVENSLSRLQTDYIDIYLAHSLDLETPIEETLRAFDDLVRQGKVRYIGCSNFGAWQVCKALWTSDRRNLTPFICVQDHYNLLDRRIERELIPLCQSEGLGIMTYSATAVGLLTGHFRHGEPPPDGSVWAGNLQRFEQTMTPAADRVVETLMSIAAERGRTPAQIAIAWILSRPGISSAMIGPDASAHVDENIGGVGWKLSDEERRKLDEASAWAVNDGQIV
jgi:aryl-alcohol dehydrogenase-like predicted oxidoreductase